MNTQPMMTKAGRMNAIPPGAGAGGLEGFCSFSGMDEALEPEADWEVDEAAEVDEPDESLDASGADSEADNVTVVTGLFDKLVVKVDGDAVEADVTCEPLSRTADVALVMLANDVAVASTPVSPAPGPGTSVTPASCLWRNVIAPT